MTPDEPQATTQPPKARQEQAELRCPDCKGLLAAYHATSALTIRVRCDRCSRAQRRGIWHSFVIVFAQPNQPT